MMDVNQIYYGDHFTICTNIKLCYISKTAIMLHVNYLLIKSCIWENWVIQVCQELVSECSHFTTIQRNI